MKLLFIIAILILGIFTTDVEYSDFDETSKELKGLCGVIQKVEYELDDEEESHPRALPQLLYDKGNYETLENEDEFSILEISDHKLDDFGFELMKLSETTKENTLPILEKYFKDIGETLFTEYIDDLGDFVVAGACREEFKMKYIEQKKMIDTMKNIVLERLKQQEKYKDMEIDVIPIHQVVCRDTEIGSQYPRFHIDFAGMNEEYMPLSEEEFMSMFSGYTGPLVFPNVRSDYSNKGNVVEMINMWGPLFEDASQNILGFLPPVERKNMVITKLKQGYILKNDEIMNQKIILKSNMERGDVYLFRTSGIYAPAHGSIKIKDREDKRRRSFELRFMVIDLKSPMHKI